jgi:L-threonylcarbamoyladenylate synthase
MAIVSSISENISLAALAIESGQLVAFPTETVYGLGANALDGVAVATIFAAKQRPRFNPLIVHVSDLTEASRYALINAAAEKLAEAFWPGPLSLVLPRRPECAISSLVSAGLDSIAFRSPAHGIARHLLAATGLPIAAPSANRAGRISPTSAEDVEAELGDIPAMILNGGPCLLGLESTVVRLAHGTAEVLRLGALPREEIEAALGETLCRPDAATNAAHASPGQLASHYAPEARLRLGAAQAEAGEALLAFGPETPRFAGPTINLSPSGDLKEAAANLFAALRRLDRTGAATIAVMPIPAHGLGEAINDRLSRAAAER